MDHASEINLGFAFFKWNVALINLKLKAFPGILWYIPGIFNAIPGNL